MKKQVKCLIAVIAAIPLLFILPFVCSTNTSAGIYNNSTDTTPEDSLTIPFVLPDSLGNPVQVTSGDSAWLFVFYPSGALAYTDSVRLTSDAKITSRNLDVLAHAMGFYSYKRPVDEVDGGGVEGTYKYIFVVTDSSLGLSAAYTDEFQIYATADFSTWADRLDETISTRSTIGDTANECHVTGFDAGVINDAAIADDAFTYGTFAATAPTAWWNEGKTGYALSTQDWSTHSAADAGGATWDAATNAHETAGTFGEQAEFDSVGIAAIKAVTDLFQFTATNFVQVDAQYWDAGVIPAPNITGTPLVDVDAWEGSADADTAGAQAMWSYTGAYGRQLTRLDDDSTTVELDNTISTATEFATVVVDSMTYRDSTTLGDKPGDDTYFRTFGNPGAGGSAPSAATIAAAVFDEPTDDHTTTGTFGKLLIADSTNIEEIIADVTGINGADGSAWVTSDGDTNTAPFDAATDVVATVTDVTTKTGYSISGAITTLDGLNNLSTSDLNARTAIGDTNTAPFNAAGDAVANVTLVGSVTTKTGYSISGTITTLDGLNNVSTSDLDAAGTDATELAARAAIGDTAGWSIADLNNFDWTSNAVAVVTTVNGFSATAAQSLFDADTTATDPAHDLGTYGRQLIDGGSGVGGSSPWSTAEKDSVVGAITDANKENFIADVSGCAGGDGGGKTLVIWVADSSAHAGDTTDLALSGVRLTMMAEDQSQQHTELFSMANGFRSFTATASTDYAFLSYASGYNFNAVDTIEVDAGVEPDTVAIYGYPFDPGSPGSASLKRVFGWLEDPFGNAYENAVVSIRLVCPSAALRDTLPHLTGTSVGVSLDYLLDTTDADGYFLFDLIPIDDLTPGGCTYEYQAKDSNGRIIRGHDKNVRPTGTANENIADL